MHILMLISQFPPEVRGGAEMQCWRQARALVKRGHRVTVLTRWQAVGTPRWETRDGVRIGRLGFYLPWMAARRRFQQKIKNYFLKKPSTGPEPMLDGVEPTRSAPQFRNPRWQACSTWLANASFIWDVLWLCWGRRLKVDVIHVHMSRWMAGFGHWLAARLSVPAFCKEANYPPGVSRSDDADFVPFKKKWMARRRECRFFAMTEAIFSALVDLGIPAHKIFCVPNGVEMPTEIADPASRTCAIYVGNFTQGIQYKAFDWLLQAWGQAVQSEPGIQLTLYGAGKTEEWAAYAEAHGCGNTVIFAGPTSHIWAVHHQAGFLILPSRSEGMSNALLEAMASGLPVIVSDIPGNTAIVRDGIEGLVVPVDDVDALSAAILTLYRSPELRRQMGQSGRARAMERFSLNVVAEQLEAAYRRARDEDATQGMTPLV